MFFKFEENTPTPPRAGGVAWGEVGGRARGGGVGGGGGPDFSFLRVSK